jgi:hypothetical protein
MASVGSIQSSTIGSILRAADTNTQVAATLLNKAISADKNLVNTLLPADASSAGRVDIRA